MSHNCLPKEWNRSCPNRRMFTVATERTPSLTRPAIGLTHISEYPGSLTESEGEVDDSAHE